MQRSALELNYARGGKGNYIDWPPMAKKAYQRGRAHELEHEGPLFVCLFVFLVSSLVELMLHLSYALKLLVLILNLSVQVVMNDNAQVNAQKLLEFL